MPAHVQPYRIRPGQPLTIDIVGQDGTQLRVRGTLDTAPDQQSGGIATRIRLVDAQAQILDS